MEQLASKMSTHIKNPRFQGELKELTAQKEQEWRQLQHQRTEVLETAVEQLELELSEERNKFTKLKDDFKYNLRLLKERDVELEKFESAFRDFKPQMLEKDSIISDLKIKMDDLSRSSSRIIKEKDDLNEQYKQRLREKQSEIDNYRIDCDDRVQHERQQLENIKRELECKVLHLQEELEIQRRELTINFEEAMRKREHEFRVQLDEMSGTVLTHEMKAKLLSKEMELFTNIRTETTDKLADADQRYKSVENKLKHKEWEMEDLKAMKEAKIQELMSKIQQLDGDIQRNSENYQRKHADLKKQLNQKDATICKLREAAHEKEHQLQDEMGLIKSEAETCEQQLQQAQWRIEDLESEKQTEIDRLQDELNELKSRAQAQISEVTHTSLDKDKELDNLRNSVGFIKAELNQRKRDVERYKRDLAVASERESALERAKTQLNLDWQRKLESVERTQYEKSEDLVKNLTHARDEARLQLDELQRDLDHQHNLVDVLTKERNRAMSTLKQHNLILDRDVDVPVYAEQSLQAEKLFNLEKQNDNLRQVIRQMREEMEHIGETFPKKLAEKDNLVTNEYVKNLEDEIQRLKAECRNLTQNNSKDELTNTKSELSSDMTDNVVIKNHIEQLNDGIGRLRSEKVEMTTELRKQQVRLHHLESSLEQALKQPLDKQAKVEQLEYELSKATSRHDAQVTILQGHLKELELQLGEARKEADEYRKTNITQNLEITSLQKQISQFMLDSAKDRPAVNFGAQELVIQQLQDELQRVRELHVKINASQGTATRDDSIGMVVQLQTKLKAAVKHIQKLANERQQLLEIGNKMRAQLKSAGLDIQMARGNVAKSTNPFGGPPKSLLQDKIGNKLLQLEQLQYELTKQELAQQQHYVAQQQHYGPRFAVPMHLASSSTESEDDPKLKPILKDRNRMSEVAKGAQSPSKDNLLTSISSMGGNESIQEIWRMLDEEDGRQTPSMNNSLVPKSQEDVRKSAESLVLRGSNAAARKVDKPQNKPVMKSYGKVGAIGTRQKPKIRNFNMRDDK